MSSSSSTSRRRTWGIAIIAVQVIAAGYATFMLVDLFAKQSTTPITGGQVESIATTPNDWPQYRGQQRDGHTDEPLQLDAWPSGGLPILWQKNVGSGGSSVAVVGNRLFTMGNRGDDTDRIVCLDVETGETIWEHAYPNDFTARQFEGGTACTPTVADNRVYTVSTTGQVHCYAASSGDLLWTRNLVDDFGGKRPNWDYAYAPLVVDGMVILEPGGANVSVAAVDAQTGETIWTTPGPRGSYGSPVVFTYNGRKVFALLQSEQLSIYDLETGRPIASERWRTSWDVNATMPIVQGNRIFITTGYRRGCAVFELADGSLAPVWENKTIAAQMNTPVLYEGHLYGIDGNTHSRRDASRMVCVIFETGEEKWEYKGLACGSLIIADGTIIALGEQGLLAIGQATPDGFTPIGTQQLPLKRCWIIPVYSNGRLFVRDNEGNLLALDLTP